MDNMRKLLRLFLLMWLAALAQPAWANGISGLQIEAEEGRERVILYTQSELGHKNLFNLANPNRLVVDFPKLTHEKLRLPANYNGVLIRAIRFGDFSKNVVRMVLDVHHPVKVLGSYAVPPADGVTHWRYVLDIEGAEPRKDTPITKPKPPAAKPLIVIDAGHGGKDPGATGIRHTREKHVTLRYAKALQAALLKTGRYRAALIRDDDEYFLLKDRVKKAQQMKGDLFISLHADSNPRPDARGFSVYTLSETASDEEAAALAARENKTDIIGGLDLNEQDEDVASILIDLARRETMNKSAVFADTIISNLHKKVVRLPNAHRYAGFRVLKAPDIPSVLVELGFLSNKADEKLLNTREYESIISGSLVKAIDAYLNNQPSVL